MFNNNQEFEYFIAPILDDVFKNEVVYKNKDSFERNFIEKFLPKMQATLEKGYSLAGWGSDFENNATRLKAEDVKNNGLIDTIEKTFVNYVYPVVVFKIPKQYLVDTGYAGHIDKPLPLLYPIVENATPNKRGDNNFAVRTQLIEGIYTKALYNQYISNPNYSPVFNPAGGIFTTEQIKNIKDKCADEAMVKQLSGSLIDNNILYFADYRHDQAYQNLQKRDLENNAWGDAVKNYSQIYGSVKVQYGISSEKLKQCFRPNFRQTVLGEIERFDRSYHQVDFSYDSFAKSLNANHPLRTIKINNEWVVGNLLSGRYAVENEDLLLQQRFADNFKMIIRAMPDQFKKQYGSIGDSIENNVCADDNRLRTVYNAIMSTYGEYYIGDTRINSKAFRVDVRTPAGRSIMKVIDATNSDQECNYLVQELLRNNTCRQLAYDFAKASVKANQAVFGSDRR